MYSPKIRCCIGRRNGILSVSAGVSSIDIIRGPMASLSVFPHNVRGKRCRFRFGANRRRRRLQGAKLREFLLVNTDRSLRRQRNLSEKIHSEVFPVGQSDIVAVILAIAWRCQNNSFWTAQPLVRTVVPAGNRCQRTLYKEAEYPTRITVSFVCSNSGRQPRNVARFDILGLCRTESGQQTVKFVRAPVGCESACSIRGYRCNYGGAGTEGGLIIL